MEYITDANEKTSDGLRVYKQYRLSPGLVGESLEMLGEVSSGVKHKLVMNEKNKEGRS